MQKQYLNADKLEHKAPTMASKINVENWQIIRIKFLNTLQQRRKGVGLMKPKTREPDWIWL